MNVLYDYGVSSVLIDDPKFLYEFRDTSASTLAAFNNLDALRIFFKEIKKEGKKLIWLQLKDLFIHYAEKYNR